MGNSVLRVNWDDTEDVGIITHYKGEPFTGICYEVHDNGNLKEEIEMVNGLKHGDGKLFYENGQLNIDRNFKDDQQHGKFIKYYEDGKLQVESEWDNGEQRGIQKSYSEDGSMNTLDYEEEYRKEHRIRDFKDSNIKENSVKSEFLKRVRLFNEDFKNEYNFTIDFGGNGGGFFTDNYEFKITTNDGEMIEGHWDYHNDDNFLYDLIHDSGIKIDYNDYGTTGIVEYNGSTNKLIITTIVIGDVDEDDDELEYEEIEDKYGKDYSLDIN
jgi:uncharacterized protein